MLKYLHDIITALEAILHNRMKSFLTTLGIIFGVAAVISMLAIGRGAQKEILEQIKLVGVNNILIEPLSSDKAKEQKDKEAGKKEIKKFSRGLTLLDAKAIYDIIPTINSLSPEINKDIYVLQNGKRTHANLIGIDSSYFSIFNIKLEEGKYFNSYHYDHTEPVCIIGIEISAKKQGKPGRPVPEMRQQLAESYRSTWKKSRNQFAG
ncbi:MAG: ABC transporter permease [Bacteroidia bacterium]|nr:ABC transporter permease [Bacteroidia bacterium]